MINSMASRYSAKHQGERAINTDLSTLYSFSFVQQSNSKPKEQNLKLSILMEVKVLSFAAENPPLLGSAFENACKYLDDYLGSRSFFVDYSFSIADILIWSSLLETRQRWESLRKSKKYCNLSRWFNSLLAEYGGCPE
ncbi:hypothetical protein L3X38_041814 [Prunus dulcis]|uniref:GST C-terminal domain-containing protein n=1 Tax=Prunus dulcis TaxID=3755 RepID=A0AAD4UV25_PRUDU|nr:hypothetical protein L3X38_041814 [Prunus dulcis]